MPGLLKSKSEPPGHRQDSSGAVLPFTCRNDLEYRVIIGYTGSYIVVKDPVGLKYHKLSPEQKTLLQFLNGQRTLEDIRREFNAAHPDAFLSSRAIQQQISDLHDKGLTRSHRMGQGPVLQKQAGQAFRKKLWGTVANFLFLRLPGWDADRFLQWMLPVCGWMFSRTAVCFAMLFVMSSWLYIAFQFDHVRRQLPEFSQFFGLGNLMSLWITFAIAKIIHELGHGISCRRFGAACHEIGVMLLVFSPTLYCDVTDSWMLSRRSRRIAIAAAGMYVELILSAIALYVWMFTDAGPLHYHALNLWFATTVTTVIFNANPLMRLDGYYILSDFLGIPNLRQRSNQVVEHFSRQWCLGIRQEHNPYKDDPILGLVIYYFAAGIYRVLLLLGILLVIREWLLPMSLLDVTRIICVVMCASLVMGPGRKIYQLWKSRETWRMKRINIIVTSCVAVAMIALLSLVPIPWYGTAPIIAQPDEVRHIYTLNAGRLTELLVKPGEMVSEGDVLVKLANEELLDQLDAARLETERHQIELRFAVAKSDSGARQLARQQLANAGLQLKQLEEQVARLTLRAPVSGRVIAGAARPVDAQARRQGDSSTWSGLPTDEQNMGAVFEEGTHFVSIAPKEETRVLLHVNQDQRNDIQVGDRVDLRFDSAPDQLFQGTVELLASENQTNVDPTLTTQYGGALTTVADEFGHERLMDRVYVATLVLPVNNELISPGTRGIGRFTRQSRSVFAWSWRAFRQTFALSG
ncbi:biotin/lipoyl-binding protein [Calycomorphotria hydatis]|uniref:Peptide zinc metalloprotease protein YydH n=1 Tax=Calycomorphotria hydatis TaxID=2528027 RepID=A0A517T925_9PLAN|nr:biotin/lipoyl-binding protein [Calycomorphotria hydatis]QDT64858.1 Putative peptide zinc metalloprotease protein YydH [Calycomorphotria hydatis]